MESRHATPPPDARQQVRDAAQLSISPLGARAGEKRPGSPSSEDEDGVVAPPAFTLRDVDDDDEPAVNPASLIPDVDRPQMPTTAQQKRDAWFIEEGWSNAEIAGVRGPSSTTSPASRRSG
jgi:hypothetical protein